MSRKKAHFIFFVVLALCIAAAAAWVLTRPRGEIFEWIQYGGYPVLFLLLFCCGLGLPLPEDIPLVISGILVHTGHFSLGMAAGVAWCGIIGGDCMLYLLGMKFGPDIVDLPIVGRHINAKRLATVEQYFIRWGIWVVAIGRMIAVVRGAMVVVAGVSRFNFLKFIIADGFAAIVSGGLFLLIGYKFAQYHEHIVRKIKHGMFIAIAVVAIGFVGYLWQRNRAKSVRGVEGLPVDPKGPSGMPQFPGK